MGFFARCRNQQGARNIVAWLIPVWLFCRLSDLPVLRPDPRKWGSPTLRSAPNVAEGSLEIASQHLLDHLVRVPSAMQLVGDQEHPLWRIEPLDVEGTILTGRANAQPLAFRDRLLELFLCFWRVVPRRYPVVGTDPNVIGAAHLERMLDVPDHVLLGWA